MEETNFPGKIDISLSVGKEWGKNYVDVFLNEGNAGKAIGAVVYDGTLPCLPFRAPQSPL